MLTNRHKQTGIRGAGAKAQTWPCMPETRRGGLAVAGLVVCLSSSAYLAGGEPGLQRAASIENPRFADQRENQI
jgi:hypothetical protein